MVRISGGASFYRCGLCWGSHGLKWFHSVLGDRGKVPFMLCYIVDRAFESWRTRHKMLQYRQEATWGSIGHLTQIIFSETNNEEKRGKEKLVKSSSNYEEYTVIV